MSSYRFCRSDDVPLLVDAYNDCYRPHFPELPPLTVDRFKSWIRERDLWTSSCMVAFAGDEPIGVLLAAKRDHANRILCVGVRPGHQGRGHGSHLMTSLSQKLAILKPSRMECELDEKDDAGRRFVSSCGYAQETSWQSWHADPLDEPPPGSELLMPVGVDEPAAAGLLESSVPLPWARAVKSLRNLRDELHGLALATDTVEAFALYHDDGESETRRVLGFGAAPSVRAAASLSLVLRACRASTRRPLEVPGVHRDEIDPAMLAGSGFGPGKTILRYAAEALPA